MSTINKPHHRFFWGNNFSLKSEISLILSAETAERSWRRHLLLRFCQNWKCQPNSFQCFKYKVFRVVTSFLDFFFENFKDEYDMEHRFVSDRFLEWRVLKCVNVYLVYQSHGLQNCYFWVISILNVSLV